MIILDIEATGTNAIKHSILSLGAIDFARPERRFYGECQLWDGAHIMDGALAINGFSESEARDIHKQTEAELITQFMEWTQECAERTLVGQSVYFDRAYVLAACERAGIQCDLPFRTLDTHTMCYMHMVKRSITPQIDSQHRRTDISLDVVLAYCGIPGEPRPHNSLTGALCHGEVASRLLFGRRLFPEFSEFPLPW